MNASREHPENSSDNELPFEAVEAPETGPDTVRNPVGSELMTAQDYIALRKAGTPNVEPLNYECLNNFYSYFSPPGNMTSDIYRATPCRQRFAIAYPELTAELEELVWSGVTTTPSEHPEGKLDSRFVTAYELMAQLVDRDDPSVLRSDGSVDEFYLIH
jgi:hypothetical protein